MSAKTCSTTAWSRCCPSAWISSNGEPVNTAWYRQRGNNSSRPAAAGLFRSRTRRTTSRAVTALPFFDANAVYPVSATSASETQAPIWSSQIACGYRIRGPGILADGGDRGADAGIRRDGDGEPGAAAADRADHGGVVIGRVQPHDDRPGAAAVPGGSDGTGGQAGRAARGCGVAAAQPGGGDHRRRQRRADHGGQRVQAPDQQRLAPDPGVPEPGALLVVAVDALFAPSRCR